MTNRKDIIVNKKDAQDWLNTWGDKMRRGILGSAIDSLEKSASIESTRRSKDELETREAIGILKVSYFQRYGKAYIG